MAPAAQRSVRGTVVLEPHPYSYDPSIGRNHQARRPREEWVEIPVPAIISEDTFEAVQKAAHDNSIFSPRRTEPDTFLLRRLVRCGHCGVKLAAHRAYRDYGMARYYLCPHHDPVRAGGQDRRCPERRIRADELDNFVFDQVRQLLGSARAAQCRRGRAGSSGPGPRRRAARRPVGPAGAAPRCRTS